MNPSEYFDLLENPPLSTPREIFAKCGFVPAAPAGLTGGELRGRLWELLHACAARRFFFSDTNHLDDRDFFLWLDRSWLDRETADLPPEAEMNSHFSPVEPFGDPEEEEIWLRYYADESDRMDMEQDEPDVPLPPHEDPPFDRDRFLPTPQPPVPVPFVGFEDEDDEPETAWEKPASVLQRGGYTPLPPAEITPEAQGGLLWELLHELACRGFYVHGTNHLTDEQLYAELWQRGLREDAILPGGGRSGGWFYDFSYDDGSDAPREKLPPVADRDWRLPRWRHDLP